MRNNPDVCKELLEILLEIEIDHIEMHGEETVEIDFGSKGIRLDVYAKNAKQAFNLEMQATDTKELPERARYYQGSSDGNRLDTATVETHVLALPTHKNTLPYSLPTESPYQSQHNSATFPLILYKPNDKVYIFTECCNYTFSLKIIG